MRVGTVCFIAEKNQVLLFLIKYPDGTKRWNGIGGFVDRNETPEESLIRETKEEINIILENQHIKEVKRVNYPEKNLQLIVYLCNSWQGELKLLDQSIKEYKWFSLDEIPYHTMWPDNIEWLPKILLGNTI